MSAYDDVDKNSVNSKKLHGCHYVSKPDWDMFYNSITRHIYRTCDADASFSRFKLNAKINQQLY